MKAAWPRVCFGPETMHSRMFAVVAGLAGAVGACSLGEENVVNVREIAQTEALDAGAATQVKPSGVSTTSSSCTGSRFTKPDLSRLKACKTGGHCYASSAVPAKIQSALIPCDSPGESCVPDEILLAGGDKIRQCTQPDNLKSYVGGGGGCVTLALLPELEQKAGAALKQQECNEGQVCVPCTDPRDKSDTPFCQPTGVLDDTCSTSATGDGGSPVPQSASPPTEQPCCTTDGESRGVCTSDAILPEGDKDAMPQDVCAKGKVCMPAAMLKGDGKPCDSGIIGGPGVCLGRCFNNLLKIGGLLQLLKADVCDEAELCVPCGVLKSQMPEGVPVPGCK